MFFIYGTTGQVFRGSLEQMRQVKGVGSLTRARRVAPLGRDGADEADDAAARSSIGESATAMRGPALARAYGVQSPPQRRPLLQVAQVMSREVHTVAHEATVFQAWQMLARRGVGQMPVVDSAGALVGLLTRADLLRALVPPAADAPAPTASELWSGPITRWMQTPVPGVAADSDIRRVAQVLLDTGLPGLPVLGEQGQVIGFISRSDILQAVVTDPPLDLWG